MSETQVQYRAGGGLAHSTITLLFLTVPMGLFMMGTEWGYHLLVNRAVAGEMITEMEWVAKEGMVGMAAIGTLILFLTTAVVFCCWKYRAYKNLKALGARELEYSPGWAVGYYFIPLLHLVRPAQVMSEIWRASGPEVKTEGPAAWKALKPTHLITGWWAAWITSGILARISLQTASSASPETLTFSTYVGMAGSAISILGALFLISLIKGITRRQDALAQGMTSVSPSPLGNDSQAVPAMPAAHPAIINAEGYASHLPQPSPVSAPVGETPAPVASFTHSADPE